MPGSGGDRGRALTLRYLLYGFLLVSGCMQFAVVPLLPAYAHRFGLSHVAQGLVLACTGLATFAVSVPAGAISDRLGARRVTLAAGALMAGAAVIQAFAPDFALLLLSRLVFGAGYGVTWTAGISWLAESSPGGSSLGGSVASAGIGGTIGPALFGLLAEYFGLALPFLLAGVAFLVVTAALALVRLPSPQPAPATRLGPGIAVALNDRFTLSATAVVIVAGMTSGASALLAPNMLHVAGSSTGTIGLAFGLAGLLFVLGSVGTASAGSRGVRLAVALGGMSLLAAALSPAVLSSAPAAVVLMLCGTSAARSVIWTIAYPLGAIGAERSGVGVGLVMGVMNGMWAATAVLSPLFAGAVADRFDPRAAFALTEVACFALVAATFVMALRGRRHALRLAS